MKDKLHSKLNNLLSTIKQHDKYDIQDELFYQVLGHILFGYAVGLGRLILYLDMEDIKEVLIKELVSLGPAEKYTKGMIEAATQIFMEEKGHPIYKQLIDVGHSHYADSDFSELVESIFENTESIKRQM